MRVLPHERFAVVQCIPWTVNWGCLSPGPWAVSPRRLRPLQHSCQCSQSGPDHVPLFTSHIPEKHIHIRELMKDIKLHSFLFPHIFYCESGRNEFKLCNAFTTQPMTTHRNKLQTNLSPSAPKGNYWNTDL